jgi:hypothetical protein
VATDDPYIVKSEASDLYKVEWQSGSSLFSEGDLVILTTGDGLGQMISPESEEVAWPDSRTKDENEAPYEVARSSEGRRYRKQPKIDALRQY